MNCKLVIFDCDGVLVDSESLSLTVFVQLLSELGFKIDPPYAQKLFQGYSLTTCIQTIQSIFGKNPPETLKELFYQRLFAEFRKNLLPIENISTTLDVLDTLKIPYCVASSGEFEKMQVTLSVTGLWSRFCNNIFSATQVSRGKPFPDLFLYAAEKNHVHPKDCIVVEDSLPGIEAGLKANMKVFAYIAQAHYDVQLIPSSVYQFRSMKELPLLLQIA